MLTTVTCLISNNVHISCFELTSMKIRDSYFIDFSKIFFLPALEDFYVDAKAINLLY